jgi:hypothetical protein
MDEFNYLSVWISVILGLAVTQIYHKTPVVFCNGLFVLYILMLYARMQ